MVANTVDPSVAGSNPAVPTISFLIIIGPPNRKSKQCYTEGYPYYEFALIEIPSTRTSSLYRLRIVTSVTRETLAISL
jgi:hypothetical protein